jgi:hypothetical protein
MFKKVTRATVVSLVLTGAFAAHAGTVITKRIQETRQVIPLKKLTVGPDDQYHGLIDKAGKTLYFTRKSDLVPHICSQNLQTGQVTEIVPMNADSQEPAINSKNVLAFTYYQKKATGDICYIKLDGSLLDLNKIKCLAIEEGEPASPFWRGKKELGYLLRNTWTQTNRIILENIDTGQKTVLAEGRIWSPAISPDGETLFYNEMPTGLNESNRLLVMKNLKSGQRQVIRFSLPGISGFPAVSEDGKYLYFSHYMNDTNHDNVIDGKDNSVIFRVAIERFNHSQEVFPEQLTSVARNCSFPKPQGNRVYVTCAFEGSLDVYEMPVTGVIPSAWDQKTLENAHQTSRSYADRLLILNTLKVRFPAVSVSSLEERILSDYLFADDIQAAQYSVRKLREKSKQTVKTNLTGLRDLLDLYLQGREKKKVQKLDYISPSFQKEILEIDSKIERTPGPARFKSLIRGLLQSFLNQPQKSYEFLSQVKFLSASHPLERVLYFELVRWVIPRVSASMTMDQVYREMMRAPELSSESQIYYAFRFLDDLQRKNLSLQDRIRLISHTNRDLPQAPSVLLKSETAVLQLIQDQNEDKKTVHYRELDQMMNECKSDYFLRKALYIRAILNFEQAAEFKYLNFVAANWLRYTQMSDTEFLYSRNVYSNSSLDQAYSNLGKNKPDLAANYFYGSLSLTDDLESHFGYIQTLIGKGQRATLQDRYQNLEERKMIEENRKYVDALLILADAHPQSPSDVTHLDLALEKLQSMQEGRDAALRYLLIGYCKLEKLIRTGNGYEFNRELFEEANRNLMLAYDQGRGNPRVEASALFDLGLLHQRVGNHGLATKFFGKRKSLDFVSSEERARFSWLYSRSLFFNYQPEQASLELNQVLDVPPGFQAPYGERRAFYLLLAHRYSEAVEGYESLLQKHLSELKQSPPNLAKIYLSYGYALLKLKKEQKAKAALNESLKFSDTLTVIPKNSDRWVQFEPSRIQMMAYGFLSQVGSRDERIQALEKRLVLLSRAKGIFNSDEWLPNQMRNHVQLAALQSERDVNQAVLHMESALDLAEQFGKATQYLGFATYRTTVDYLVHRITHWEAYQKQSSQRIQKQVENILKAYHQQTFGQEALDYQRVMLQVLQNEYSVRHSDSRVRSDEILQSESALRLKMHFPEKWIQLQNLAKNLKDSVK